MLSFICLTAYIPVRRAPHRIPAVSPGMRLLVTAIIPGSRSPTEVTITLRLLDGTTLDYRAPVQMISLLLLLPRRFGVRKTFIH